MKPNLDLWYLYSALLKYNGLVLRVKEEQNIYKIIILYEYNNRHNMMDSVKLEPIFGTE